MYVLLVPKNGKTKPNAFANAGNSIAICSILNFKNEKTSANVFCFVLMEFISNLDAERHK